MPPPRVVAAIGELLWDVLPTGKQLGGAPANFAYHVRGLGAVARLVTRVGNDDLGREARAALVARGLSDEWVQCDLAAPTSTAEVELTELGQPRFTIKTDVAWDHIDATPSAQEAVAAADAVYFGTLAQRTAFARRTIERLLEAAPVGALRVCDVNLREPHAAREVVLSALQLANVVKLNEAELTRIAGWLQLQGDARDQVRALAHRHGWHAAALTRGERGSLLWSNDVFDDHPGLTLPVATTGTGSEAMADTVGAGDAFAAALTVGLLRGLPLGEIHQGAAELAAHVCTQPGAMPPHVAHRFQRF